MFEIIFDKFYFKDREEWLKERGRGIGGSDASAVLGYNYYKNNVDLYKEKIGEKSSEVEETAVMEYGRNAEEPMRKLFALDYADYLDVYFEECLFIRKDKPFIRGTLDSFCYVKKDFDFMSYWRCPKGVDIKEIEIPKPITFRKDMIIVYENKTTEVLSSMAREKWDNTIPDNYYIQVLHYLLVTGFDGFILRVKLKWKDRNGVITYEMRDYGMLKSQVREGLETLERNEEYFWKECVEKRKEPPLLIRNLEL